MMLPIAHAVLEEIKEENQIISSENNADTVISVKYTKTTYNSTHGSEVNHERNRHNEDGSSGEESKLVGESGTRNRDRVRGREEASQNDSEAQGKGGEATSDLLEVKLEEGDAVEENDSGERVEVTTSQLLTDSGTSGRSAKSGGDNKKTYAKLTKCLMLGVAYVGGTATLTGTGPNIALSGLAR